MRIERTRFLQFAALISAGCTPTQAVTPPPPVAKAKVEAPRFPAGYEAIAKQLSPYEGTDPIGGPADECCSWMPKSNKPEHHTPCTDPNAGGAVVACNALEPDQTCGTAPYLGEVCRGAHRFLRPSVARLAVQTLADHIKSGRACEPLSVYRAIQTSLYATCVDDAVVPLCERLVKSCAAAPEKISQEACVHTLSGLNDAGREAMEHCLAGPSCGPGLWVCSVGIRD